MQKLAFLWPQMESLTTLKAEKYLLDMANDHIWVPSHPGHSLATIGTLKAADPCKK